MIRRGVKTIVEDWNRLDDRERDRVRRRRLELWEAGCTDLCSFSGGIPGDWDSVFVPEQPAFPLSSTLPAVAK
jgi:hypothetical protein